MTIPRLYVTHDLCADDTVTLDDKQAHYLIHVLRKKSGDHVLLFNGRDGEWDGIITGTTKKTLCLQLQTRSREQQATPDIWLLFAPIKAGRIDFLAEKATELGVSRLMPVQTQRTIVSRVNHKKLCLNAVEAAEQTERLDVPDVASYEPLHNILSRWDSERTLIYADETGAGANAEEILSQCVTPLAVLIGPEGGFAPSELEHLRGLDYAKALSLGPRILRAETAALASLTLLQLYCGDWNAKART